MLRKSESGPLIYRRVLPVGIVYSVRCASILGLAGCGVLVCGFSGVLRSDLFEGYHRSGLCVDSSLRNQLSGCAEQPQAICPLCAKMPVVPELFGAWKGREHGKDRLLLRMWIPDLRPGGAKPIAARHPQAKPLPTIRK